MPEPHTHYFEVQMKVTDFSQPYVDFKMAVWTPGSYLIREFSKSVEGFSAQNGSGQALKYEKTKKNTWRVFAENTKSITISYRVYAFEASVRTSIADASHGYINPTSVCMFVPQLSQNPLTVKIVPFKDWKNISTGLEPAGADKFTLKADNYDMLADCPIEVGNHKVLIFRADGGTQYEMAMYGDANYNETQLIADMKTVVEETGKVVGENPNKRYVFLVHHYTNGSGGLEHKNSTTLDVSRNTYQANYAGFLSLVAHEYFHLWNVKRIRAKALGPFDYENENYTHLLWVAEGFTTYYQNLILRRAGIITADSFVTITNNNIGTIENQPGNAVQSLAESSFDAWIKYYRTNENSNNTTVSYYTKGAVVGCLLDLEIINATNGEKNLDDVFKFLYNEYFKKQQRGFTDEEMQQAVEKVAGKSMKDFFENHISDTKTIDYNRIFGYAGFRMSQVPVSNGEGYLGANFNLTNGKLLVTSTLRGASAYTYGLNVNDEILAADGLRINSAEELNRLAESKRAGEKISLLISRDNLIKTLEITLGKSPQVRYKLEKLNNLTEKQQKIQQKWLRL
ncbi:MAG: M61 family metallopeptidase [Verrucomicrobia bacterium]|nr:M61 family metallopeptidase [Cytophagales bacterium]